VWCLLFRNRPDQISVFFPREKEKSGIFFGSKKFAGPGDPVFLEKIRNCRKIHADA